MHPTKLHTAVISYLVLAGVEPGVFPDSLFLKCSLSLLLRSSFVSPSRFFNKGTLTRELSDNAGLFLATMLELIDDRDATLSLVGTCFWTA